MLLSFLGKCGSAANSIWPYRRFTIQASPMPASPNRSRSSLSLSFSCCRTAWRRRFGLLHSRSPRRCSHHLLCWVLVAPVNKVWLKGEALSAPARQFFGSREDRDRTDWISLRNRWEWSHVCRAASSMAAFLLLLVAVLGPLREDGHF